MKVALRKLTKEDTALVVQWRNQDEVRRNLFTQTELTEAQHLKYYETRILTGLCEQFIVLADGNPVGTTFLKNVNRERKTAEFGIFLGEQRGRGIGTKATELTIRHAFETMKLDQVVLSVFSDNTAAIRAYERVGFLRMGTEEQAALSANSPADAVWMRFDRQQWQRLIRATER